MAKLTVLQATQRILSASNGDEIESISDTEEATRVAYTLRRCFRDIVVEQDLGHLGELVRLEQTGGDTAKPTLLRIPDNVTRIEWINYGVGGSLVAASGDGDEDTTVLPTIVLTGEMVGDDAQLSWAATAGTYAIDHYEVERRLDAGAFAVLEDDEDTTTYLDVTVELGVAYSYRVRAVDTLGFTGPYSNIVELGALPDLLLHFDGADGSLVITDSGVNAFTITNTNIAIDTAQSKFGGSSGLITSGTYARIPNAELGNALDFGSQNFTVEAWTYATNFRDREQYILDSSGRLGFGVFRDGSSGPTALIYYHLTTTPATFNFLGHTTPIAAGQWNHLAIAREGINLRFFVNGTLVGTSNVGANVMAPWVQLDLANEVAAPTARYWPGWLDEIRIIVGRAMYTASFDVPTAPFYPAA
jgi:hypothetical protein